MSESTRKIGRAAMYAAGICATVALALPTVANAAGNPAPTTPCTVGQLAAARADSAPKVAAYLQAHPDVDQALTALRGEPKDQRRADAKAYFADHRDVAAALKDARSAERTLREQCRLR